MSRQNSTDLERSEACQCEPVGAFMYRLVDGRIAERWARGDDLDIIRKLGAIW